MYNFRDKKHNIEVSNRYVLAKTLSMFKWMSLPDTIPARELEKMLQVNGYAFITEVEGNLYAFTGGLGGVPDVYGNPTQIVIANPALKFNATLDLETDGVLLHNDDMDMGIMPLVTKYNTMMVENDVTITLHGFNTRINTMISASDDRTKESADKFLNGVEAGNLAAIGESAMFDGIKAHKGGDTVPVTSLIELQQYMKAGLHNEIGLSANFNMKRERLTTDEVNQNSDSIYPFVDNMMDCRVDAIDKINDKYGLNITIEYGSVWAERNEVEVAEESPNPEGQGLEVPAEVRGGMSAPEFSELKFTPKVGNSDESEQIESTFVEGDWPLNPHHFIEVGATEEAVNDHNHDNQQEG